MSHFISTLKLKIGNMGFVGNFTKNIAELIL